MRSSSNFSAVYRPEFLKHDSSVHDSTARLPRWTMSDESAPWRLELGSDLLPIFILFMLQFYYRDHSVSFYKYLVTLLFTSHRKQEACRISHVGLDILIGQDSLHSSSLLACISMLPVQLLNFWHKGCTCDKIPIDLWNRTAIFKGYTHESIWFFGLLGYKLRQEKQTLTCKRKT